MGHVDPRELEKLSDEQRKAKREEDDKDLQLHWKVVEGDAVNDGQGVFMTTDKDYGDLDLWIDFKLEPAGDSGIYLRGTPQVQIWDFTFKDYWKMGADKGSGGLWNNTPETAGRDPVVVGDHPIGEWNRFHIIQIGDRTSVWLNDKLVVNKAPLENYYDRTRPLFPTGPVQLQTHGGVVHWRNIFAREIPAEEANAMLRGEDAAQGFEPIFNGTDLDGWMGAVDSYEVKEGSIVCKEGKGGALHTKKEYADFVVRVEFKLPEGGNNGIAIRYPGEGDPAYMGMCELQVLDTEHKNYKDLDPRQAHGSAYRHGGRAPRLSAAPWANGTINK